VSDSKLRVGISKLLHSGSRGGTGLSTGPTIVEEGGLHKLLEDNGCSIVDSRTATLTPEEAKEYGAWHLVGIANYHLKEIVSEQLRDGLLPIGLLSNCNGLMGMLAGVQHSGPTNRPLKVGLVWIDAHGDINTPRLRLKCGLDPALPTKYVTMAGVRDTDPLEQEILDNTNIEHITVEQIRNLTMGIDLEMERLATHTDLIYIHVDLDILDPEEVPGHGLTVADGPTSIELANALEMMFEHPSAAAFGVASYPSGRDPDGRSLKALYNLIEGVVRGVKNRES